MSLNFTRRSFLGAAGTASLFLAACGGDESGDTATTEGATPTDGAAAGANIGVMLYTNVMSLDTDLATDGDSFEVIADCIDGLTQMDAEGAAVPALAETIDVSEDGMT